jgi:hypothetical protein
MAVIQPKNEPPVTAVAAGDIFLIDGATGVRALAASVVPILDASGNVSINNISDGFATTATAGGTTTLTVASAGQQFFTGTLAQTVVLPVPGRSRRQHGCAEEGLTAGRQSPR